MKQFLNSKVRKAGAAPGLHVAPKSDAKPKSRLDLHCYSSDTYKESRDASQEEALQALSEHSKVWLNLSGLDNLSMVQELGTALGVHPLVLEDMVSPGNRSKVEDHGNYLFIVLSAANWEDDILTIEQVCFIIGSNYVFSCHDSVEPRSFAAVRERIRLGQGRIRRQGVDYLAYALMDAVVDDYFQIMDRLVDMLEDIDEQVYSGAGNDILPQLHQVRRQLIDLRRTIWPIRDSLVRMVRVESHLIADEVSIFFRDVHDHLVELSDILDSFRDMTSNILDTYHSMAAQKLNEVMKLLTLVATIFIPLTFVAGVYGMNFVWMPELKFKWGYFAVLGVMLIMFLGMVAYFKKKKWL